MPKPTPGGTKKVRRNFKVADEEAARVSRGDHLGATVCLTMLYACICKVGRGAPTAPTRGRDRRSNKQWAEHSMAYRSFAAQGAS